MTGATKKFLEVKRYLMSFGIKFNSPQNFLRPEGGEGQISSEGMIKFSLAVAPRKYWFPYRDILKFKELTIDELVHCVDADNEVLAMLAKLRMEGENDPKIGLRKDRSVALLCGDRVDGFLCSTRASL